MQILADVLGRGAKDEVGLADSLGQQHLARRVGQALHVNNGKTLNELVPKFVTETIGKEIEKATQGIYPLQNVLIHNRQLLDRIVNVNRPRRQLGPGELATRLQCGEQGEQALEHRIGLRGTRGDPQQLRVLRGRAEQEQRLLREPSPRRQRLDPQHGQIGRAHV